MVDSTITPPENQQAQHDATTNVPDKKKKPKPRFRWLKRIIIGFIILVSILFGVLYWLLSTQSGLQTAILKIPAYFGVNITADRLEGTIMDGFSADVLAINMEGLNIQSQSLNFAWQPKELLDMRVHVQQLALGDTRINTSPTPPKPKSPPASLPNDIGLPFDLVVDQLSLNGLFLEDSKEPILMGSTLTYRFTNNKHQLNIQQLQSPWSTVTGQVSLDNTTPFALLGKLASDGVLEGIPTTSNIDLSGSLEHPVLNAQIQGGDVLLITDAKLSPFEPLLNNKIQELKLAGSNINPQAFIASAPKAQMSLALLLGPVKNSDQLQGIITLANIEAGYVDESAIPVKTIFGDLLVNQEGVLNISNLEISTLKDGFIEAFGQVDTAKQSMNLDVAIDKLTLGDIINNPLKNTLAGDVKVTGTFASPQVNWHLNAAPLISEGQVLLATDNKKAQQTLEISKTYLGTQQGGRLDVDGFLNLFQEQTFELALKSKNINPSNLDKSFPIGNINGDIQAKGQLADGFQLNALLDIPDSRLSGVNLRGKGNIVLANEHLEKADVNVILGPNTFKTNGSFGLNKDRLNIDINAPQLSYFGFGLSGALQTKGFLAGAPEKLKIDLSGSANQVQFQKMVRLQQLKFNLLASPDITAPLNIDVSGQNLALLSSTGDTIIDNISLNAKGTGSKHTLTSHAQMKLDNKPFRMDVAANGGLDDKAAWKGNVSTLDVSGAFNIKLRNSMRLEASAERVSLSQANWGLMNGQLNLQSFLWSAKEGIKTKGNANGLAISQLQSLVDIPIEQNLVLGADWDLNYGNNMSGFLKVRHQSGDITIPYRNQKLGLSKLALVTNFQNNRINNQLDMTTHYGTGHVQMAIAQNFGNDIMKAPLTGKVALDVPDLNALRYFLPVGMTLKGKLAANINISGSFSNPQLNGPLNGDNITFREMGQGLLLTNGVLRSRVTGQKWFLDDLSFKRGEGSAHLNGNVGLVGDKPNVHLDLALKQFGLFAQPNRHLVLSGAAKLTYTDLQALSLDGNFKVDDGLFDFPKSGMPSLSDDVVVLGRKAPEDSMPMLLNLNLGINFNDAFRFKGQGLDIVMGGKLLLTARPHEDLVAHGQINIVKGGFKAYGQDLVIEKGIVSFLGPLDNPGLNFRAVRNKSPVGAGVEVRGSLNKPDTILVANEPMSDKDKLSWLVLGRPTSGESDNAALAAAAGAWLASGVNDKMGLFDDIGMGSRQTRNMQTGELNPAEQMITVGRNLTNELYVGYEYGLTSSDSAVKLIYQLSRSIQAIVRVGTLSQNGEIRYTIRFD